MIKKLLTLISIAVFSFALLGCGNDNVNVNPVLLHAEFHVGVSDEEIAYVIAAIDEHPLVIAYEFRDRYEEHDRIVGILVGDNDELRGLFAEAELADIIIIEIVDIYSLEEVSEFIYHLESIAFFWYDTSYYIEGE